MEKNDGTPLIFCGDEIYVTNRDCWDEIVSLTFLNNDGDNISYTRLAYEDEIYIEHNDQINYIYSFYEDVEFVLTESLLSVSVKPKKICNMPTKMEISLNPKFKNLQEIIDALKAPPKCLP